MEAVTKFAPRLPLADAVIRCNGLARFLVWHSIHVDLGQATSTAARQPQRKFFMNLEISCNERSPRAKYLVTSKQRQVGDC